MESGGANPDGRPSEDQPRWRRDFPIDWPQDAYVSRREFTRFMVLTSFAFAVGQGWILAQTALRRPGAAFQEKAIATVADVPVGSAKVFSLSDPNEPYLLVRMDEKTFVSYSQKCTHLSCPVVPEPQLGRLHCPCHEGAFDLATGRPIMGPPRRPLNRVILEIRQGTIYATGLEERSV